MRRFATKCFHCVVNGAASVGLLIGVTTLAFSFAWILGYMLAVLIGGIR